MPYPGKGKADYFAPGDWNAECWDCGRKWKASQMRRNWQGFYECSLHWTPRQPQDFVRAINDVQTPPWVQPLTTTAGLMCTPNGTSAVPGQMEPGCIVPGYLSPFYNPDSPY